MASVETIRVGFLFADRSFFNCVLRKEAWENLLARPDGNYYLQNFVGKKASELGLNLSSPNVQQAVLGGLHQGLGLQDNAMYLEGTGAAEVEPSQLSQSDSETAQPETEEPSQTELSQAGASGWNHGAVLLLLEEYRDHKRFFSSPILKKVDVWKKIAAAMAAKGCHFTHDSCDKKWCNLKIRYKTIHDNNNKTGRGRSRWPYLDLMEDILHADPSVTPPVIVSSIGGVKVTASASSQVLGEKSQARTSHTPDERTPGKTPDDKRTPEEEPKLVKKKRRRDDKSQTFREYAEFSMQMQTKLLEATKERNDLLKQLIEKL